MTTAASKVSDHCPQPLIGQIAVDGTQGVCELHILLEIDLWFGSIN